MTDKERLDFLEENSFTLSLDNRDGTWWAGNRYSSTSPNHWKSGKTLRESIDNLKLSLDNECKCRHCGSDKGSFCENCGKPWTESDGVEDIVNKECEPKRLDMEVISKLDEALDLGLKNCEQCNEKAWDGRICHSCGFK